MGKIGFPVRPSWIIMPMIPIIAALRGHQIASWNPMINVISCTLRFWIPLPLPVAWPGPAVVPLRIQLELAHFRIVVAYLIPKPESGAQATIRIFACQTVPSTTEREHTETLKSHHHVRRSCILVLDTAIHGVLFTTGSARPVNDFMMSLNPSMPQRERGRYAFAPHQDRSECRAVPRSSPANPRDAIVAIGVPHDISRRIAGLLRKDAVVEDGHERHDLGPASLGQGLPGAERATGNIFKLERREGQVPPEGKAVEGGRGDYTVNISNFFHMLEPTNTHLVLHETTTSLHVVRWRQLHAYSTCLVESLRIFYVNHSTSGAKQMHQETRHNRST